MRDDGGCKHCVHHGDEREQDPVDDRIPRFARVAPARDLEQRDGDGGLAPCCGCETECAGDMVEEYESLSVGVCG